ncbi:MAG: hypothetical protein LBI65_01760 [Candidatus Symbiothrix sp.]|jgi:predicted  nucleic acid-binding Zn-ribbon protein|nr:hypothetical protein [Candidatus Symbiothrix sp.]
MIKKTKAWLSSPSRQYAEGLDIFNRHAPEAMKKKFGDFLKLKSEDEKVKAFDPRFSVLINRITSILGMMKLEPGKYTLKPASPESGNSVREEILEKTKVIRELKAAKEELESSIRELQDSDDEKQDEIDDLQSELEEKDEHIGELETELEEKLSRSGLKIIRYDDLPKDIKALFDRTKEIVPLMAVIHSELSVPGISDEVRKAKAAELCRLDDERRSAWDKIDAWSEGKNSVVDVPKEEVVYSDDPLVKGMQISKRIARIEENIARTEKAIGGHVKNGKKNLEASARRRLDAYKKELAELKAMIVNE